ncbi:MAG: GspE/PulE family protein [bacterium]
MAGNQTGTDFVYILWSQEEKLKQGIQQDQNVFFVDDLLWNAISFCASDIHLQPEESGITIRYRIDGILHHMATLSHEQAHPILSRLKVLSHLDIAQRRLPQDGHIKIMLGSEKNNSEKTYNHIIDLRIATYPTISGEKMVIRLLDRSMRLLSLGTIGLPENIQLHLEKIISQQQGFFLVTGPTGCGKTTTLYAILSLINDQTKNIITIEDPVEYEISGITQSQVNSLAGFTFENGLRAILRQDPDIIMVGEIRDIQTVSIAIQASLTGHVVLSTLHTNDAPSSIARLLEMGIEPFLISSTLGGVLAQRLVRRLCDICKKEVPVPDDVGTFARKMGVVLPSMFEPRGCKACHNFGYKGRMGLFELLIINEELRSCIARKADGIAIKTCAILSGYKPMICDGLAKVASGLTSLVEVLRTTGE